MRQFCPIILGRTTAALEITLFGIINSGKRQVELIKKKIPPVKPVGFSVVRD